MDRTRSQKVRWENTSLGRQLSGTCCGPGVLFLAAAVAGDGVAITGVAAGAGAPVVAASPAADAAAATTSIAAAADDVAEERRPEAVMGTGLTRGEGQVHY